jgi:hypothetical protein
MLSKSHARFIGFYPNGPVRVRVERVEYTPRGRENRPSKLVVSLPLAIFFINRYFIKRFPNSCSPYILGKNFNK